MRKEKNNKKKLRYFLVTLNYYATATLILSSILCYEIKYFVDCKM